MSHDCQKNPKNYKNVNGRLCFAQKHWYAKAVHILKVYRRSGKTCTARISTLYNLYLVVSQNEGDMVKLVNVSRFNSGCYDLGVDSDFPCSCVPRVVSDTWVTARLQDVTDVVITHKHHWHTSWWRKESFTKTRGSQTYCILIKLLVEGKLVNQHSLYGLFRSIKFTFRVQIWSTV